MTDVTLHNTSKTIGNLPDPHLQKGWKVYKTSTNARHRTGNWIESWDGMEKNSKYGAMFVHPTLDHKAPLKEPQWMIGKGKTIYYDQRKADQFSLPGVNR